MARVLASRRLRGLLAGIGTLVVVAGLVALGVRSGYPSDRPKLLSGAAWLASSQAGQLTLLDGSSVEVAAQVQVAKRGDQVDVVQQAATAYAVNRSTGSIRRVDGATFDVTPPANPLPEAGAGLRAFAGPDALYALDSGRGVLTSADPVTLADRGAPVPLATTVSPQAAALDDAGRLWVLDADSGDLVWIDHKGQRHSRRGVAAPRAGLLVLADGAPVVVDTQRRTATQLDPGDGATRNVVNLDLRPGDQLQVSGSPHSPTLYVVANRGVLSICALSSTACDSAVPLGTASGNDLGQAVESGGRLFVPDFGSGTVWVVDLGRARVVTQAKVLDPHTHFQLLTRDGVVFYNDPNSEHAGVISLNGGTRPVAKYDPKDPDKGLSGPDPGPGSGSPTAKPSAGPTPSQPGSPPPQPPVQSIVVPKPSTATPSPTPNQAPDTPYTVRISYSKPTALVGEDIALRALTSGASPPSSIRWAFGDGQTATGDTATHHWDAAGTYQVSVRATFANGRVATASTPVRVDARQVTLTLAASGGTIAGAGVTCPPACRATLNQGQQVTLAAQPAGGYQFVGWTGACSGGATTCTLVMDGDRTVTANFQLASRPPTVLPAPVQVSPADGTLFTNYPRNTTLTWRAVTGADKYLLEVQCDTCGSSPWVPWITQTVTATSYSFTWVGDNTGRWRVTAIAPDGTKGVASGFWTFKFRTAPSTPPPPSTLPAPVQVSPSDNAVFNNFPRDTTLTWRAVTGAAQYKVEVQCDTCGSSPWVPWITQNVTGTSFSFQWVGAQQGRWRITAIAADGTLGASSGWWYFRYTV
jgi:uncharacterized repeat protein (TIGR02543 family)